MVFETLSASKYKYKDFFYIHEFEDMLSKIIKCYNLMIEEHFHLENDENKIRDVLMIEYLKNYDIRNKIGLNNFLFDREVAEDIGVGRTDIKISTLNTFSDTSAYYTIECKRLDAKNLNGKSGLNAKYIENGILRYTSQIYSCHYKTNGMIGFVVQELDINGNITSINNLLKNNFVNCSTSQALQPKEIDLDFKYCYSSKHGDLGNEILIYHLMLDFSKNIRE